MAEQLITARIATPDSLQPTECAVWEHLCGSVPALSSPFLSLHYARAVAASGADVRVCVLYRGAVAVGFLPYQVDDNMGRWLKSAGPVGAEMTDYFGLVALPDLRLDHAQLLRLARLNVLSFSHLDETQLGYGLPGEQPRIGLRIRLDQASETPLDVLLADRHKYRKDTERRTRQLVKEVGPVEFTFDVEQGREAVLEQLVVHKRGQYQRTGAPDALGDGWKPRLLRELAAYQFGGCRGLLSTMSAGGQWVAIHFGLVGNGVLQYWLPVYNPEFSKYAPGRLLIHQIIESGRQAGIHTIDRGEGDTPSKRELANEEHRFFRGVWHNQSVASGLVRGVHSIKWRFAA